MPGRPIETAFQNSKRRDAGGVGRARPVPRSARRAAGHLGLPLALWDEYGSSQEAAARLAHAPKQRRQMEIALEEIRGGKFAQEWAAEYANGYPRLEALRRQRNTMPLWELEQQTIALLRQVSRPDTLE